jgi:hypothetical protein
VTRDPRRGLAVALRALERVPSAGGGLAAAELLTAAAEAIAAGGRGPMWRPEASRQPLPDFLPQLRFTGAHLR